MQPNQNEPSSPCVRNCCLNADDVCVGCFRSLDEICAWSTSDDVTRLNILQLAAERRSVLARKAYNIQA